MDIRDRYLPPSLRRRQILALAEVNGFVRVTALAHRFGISEVTVRLDLDALANEGHLIRIHGGALPAGDRRAEERTFERASAEAPEEKAAIGLEAAGLVKSSQIVMLDAGSTTNAVSRALVEKTDVDDALVVTNALPIAVELELCFPRITVLMTGGTLRPNQHSLVNPFGDLLFGEVRADIAIVGCNGVTAEHGVTNMKMPEAEMKRAMLRAASRKILVADSTKIGTVSNTRIADIGDFDLLITTKLADAAEVARLRAGGLNVLQV